MGLLDFVSDMDVRITERAMRPSFNEDAFRDSMISDIERDYAVKLTREERRDLDRFIKRRMKKYGKDDSYRTSDPGSAQSQFCFFKELYKTHKPDSDLFFHMLVISLIESEYVMYDCPVLAHEFLRNEFVNFQQYLHDRNSVFSKILYNFDPGEFGWVSMWPYVKVLGLIIGAYYEGSVYAKNLLLLIMKTYYKSDYKHISMFNKTGHTVSLCDFCEAFGLIDYSTLKVNLDNIGAVLRSFLMLQLFDCTTGEDFKYFESICELCRKKLAKYTHKISVEDDIMFKTLKSIGSENTIHSAATDIYLYYNDMINEMLSGTEIIKFEDNSSFRHLHIDRKKLMDLSVAYGVDKQDSNDFSLKQESEESHTDGWQEKDSIIAQLEDEIRTLKKSVNEEKSKAENFYNTMSSMKAALNTERAKHENYEEMRKELIGLRNFAYSVQMEDTGEDNSNTVSQEEMLDVLRSKNVVMLGGNQNWVKKIRQYLPDMKTMLSSAMSTFDVNKLLKVDMVFIFTDSIGHCAYEKCMNAIYKYDIPYAFIHGVNIDKNIRFMYESIVAGV